MPHPDRPVMTETLRVRMYPDDKSRAVELARAAGYPDPSAYIRALLAREAANERNPK